LILLPHIIFRNKPFAVFEHHEYQRQTINNLPHVGGDVAGHAYKGQGLGCHIYNYLRHALCAFISNWALLWVNIFPQIH